MSVPSSELAPPPPLPQAECAPPPGTKSEGATLACGWGSEGGQFGRLERKPGNLSTLCYLLFMRVFRKVLFRPVQQKLTEVFCTLLLPDSVQVGRANKNGACQTARQEQLLHTRHYGETSVADPEDPNVFGPPGSGSISTRYRSGSFYNQEK